jgi:hypothetical protein
LDAQLNAPSFTTIIIEVHIIFQKIASRRARAARNERCRPAIIAPHHIVERPAIRTMLPTQVPGLVGACLLAMTAGPVFGQEIIAGAFAHDVDIGVSGHSREAGADEELGLRTAPWLDAGPWGTLRGYVLGSVNDSGGVDFAAVGLAWRWRPPRPVSRRLYLQLGLGGAAQDGYADPFQRYPDRLDLGSRFLFEPEAMVGWSFSPRWGAEFGWVHISNAGIARHNPGMDDLGARLVYRFGR